jgi:hypothetical protein
MSMRIIRLLTLIIGLALELTSGLTRAQETAGSGSTKKDAPAEIRLSPEITRPGIDPAELSFRLIPLTKCHIPGDCRVVF